MKHIFGGIIASILLGIYTYLIYIAVKIVYCLSTTDCTEYTITYFNGGMIQALSLIGGLVSALVIAELAITKKGETKLLKHVLNVNSSKPTILIVQIVAWMYVSIWIAAGATAYVVTLSPPEELPTLTTFGQAWLGLAISAAYAFFGIEPE